MSVALDTSSLLGDVRRIGADDAIAMRMVADHRREIGDPSPTKTDVGIRMRHGSRLR